MSGHPCSCIARFVALAACLLSLPVFVAGDVTNMSLYWSLLHQIAKTMFPAGYLTRYSSVHL